MRWKAFIVKLLAFLRATFRVAVGSLSFTILFYIVFALIFSTPEEKALSRQSRLYAKAWPELEGRRDMLLAAVSELRDRDEGIYRRLFDTPAPDLASVSLPPEEGDIMSRAAAVEADFREIFGLIAEHRDSLPPLESPLEDFSPAQTGASVGVKMNPVYHAELEHQGLDMIAPNGERVYAAAKGTVVAVDRSRTGLGNSVEIDHGGHYRTRYSLLSDISVHVGQKVRPGTPIGRVGISHSGLFPPHLHYEVIRDGVRVDPVLHLFASFPPYDWTEMVYMAANNVQSMD